MSRFILKLNGVPGVLFCKLAVLGTKNSPEVCPFRATVESTQSNLLGLTAFTEMSKITLAFYECNIFFIGMIETLQICLILVCFFFKLQRIKPPSCPFSYV